MAKAARIQDGVVVEVADLPIIAPPVDEEGKPIGEPVQATAADCFHPDLGFVDCDESVEVGMSFANGEFGPPPEPTPPPVEEVAARYSEAVQRHLDEVARERSYDGIAIAVSYRDDPNPKFAAEAAALFAWRSAVWTATSDALSSAKKIRALPPVPEFVAGLPAIAWP